jgi:hypothetical protein
MIIYANIILLLACDSLDLLSDREVGDSMFLRDFGELPDYTLLYPVLKILK